MTTGASLTVLPVADRAVVLRLSGAWDRHGAGRALSRELEPRLASAGRRGLCLVLDVSGVSGTSTEFRDALDAPTRDLGAEPVLVSGACPAVRAVLTAVELPGVRLCPTLEEALALVCRAAAAGPRPEAARAVPEDVRSEVFGLRAKARTSGLIGIAQGILLARYGLPDPGEAFALLRAGSQHHNVPLRVLAAAVVSAPAPRAPHEWFPGRRHVPPPVLDLAPPGPVDVRDRRQVLRAAVYTAVTVTDADAAEIHLTDHTREALVLEAHHALDAAYRDCLALVCGPPAVCARAQAAGKPVTVADVAADPALAGHPVGRATLAAGSRAVHSTPMMTTEGECKGVVSVHRADQGVWLAPAQETALGELAGDLAGWRSWYRRTVVLDALEYLHARGTGWAD
ncbi:ANTAR domain-containing protein [Streptomyces sp. NPDC014940]|uniref:ANTAR domain-containing protein n=1 Tax=Streptomyces sp. NPDC014940 TaxID=3364932 RepID=UPI0036FC563F